MPTMICQFTSVSQVGVVDIAFDNRLKYSLLLVINMTTQQASNLKNAQDLQDEAHCDTLAQASTDSLYHLIFCILSRVQHSYPGLWI